MITVALYFICMTAMFALGFAVGHAVGYGNGYDSGMEDGITGRYDNGN